MPWGTHFCLFYETKIDFLDTLVAYFRVGLSNNELCLWVMSDNDVTVEEAQTALRQAIPDSGQLAATGRLELISREEWFLQGGDFEIPKVIDLLKRKSESALAEGFSGVRLNGSTAWLQKRSSKDFEAFEHELDVCISDQRIIVLCNFPLNRSKAGEMLAAAHTHHFTVAIHGGVEEIVETTLAPGEEHSLTPRELEVITWVARGKSAWEIGEILGIAKRTVDEHAQTATRKLGAVNRTQAVALALLRRVIEI
jgi:DNA-binding CsgD family transcriptional regulator